MKLAEFFIIECGVINTMLDTLVFKDPDKPWDYKKISIDWRELHPKEGVNLSYTEIRKKRIAEAFGLSEDVEVVLTVVDPYRSKT